MKHIRIAGLMLVGLMGVAMAGSKYLGTGNVSITKNSDGSGHAYAYLGHIYNNPRSVAQWFGCQADANGNVMCHARHETNSDIVACSVKSTYLAQSVASISPDTRVVFYWDAKGKCTRISVIHSSEFQDKQG